VEVCVRIGIWTGVMFLLVVPSLCRPSLLQAQEAPDSAALVREAREAQERFEAFRGDRIPPSTRAVPGRCDVRIGRICHWFGGAGEADFPPEPPETGMARQELIGSLAGAWREVKDPWVLGQLIRYLAEGGRSGQAERLARDCGLAEREDWWCDALLGYLLHLRGDFVPAEAAFRSALEGLPAAEEIRWRTPRFILPRGEEEGFRAADEMEKARQWDRLWRFSDPLFMVEGNDRLTEHYTRLVAARMGEDAAHPFQLPWEADLEEALIRYGRYLGWSRIRSAPRGLSLEDTRNVIGHHDPASRGYLFPGEFLEAPADIPPEVWITSPREARTWYAPSYAPDFRGLEAQVARFRRGDSLLVAGAYRPDARSALADLPRAEPARRDPFAPLSDWDEGDALAGPVEAALFLVPEDGGAFHRVSGEEREGVLALLAPTGRYVSSLEVLDRDGRAAWRARQGITQTPLARGIAGISDVIVLREGAAIPGDLDEAIPLMRPGIRVAREERFVLAWEVYGLAVEDVARITIGFSSGRPGFLRRVGEFLGVVEPEIPVEVSFDETLPDDQVQVVFRAIEMQLPALDPGEYTLHVQLELPGREAAVASRPIILER
jgi:hypothetical protein